MSEAIGQDAVLPMWTIYEDPTDFPGEIMARKYVVQNGQSVTTHETIRLKTDLSGVKWPDHVPEEKRTALIREAKLRGVREAIKAVMPGATCINRDPYHDDPKIVETWL